MQSHTIPFSSARLAIFCALAMLACAGGRGASQAPLPSLNSNGFSLTVAGDGSYSLRSAGQPKPMLVAHVAAQVEHRWLRSSDYPNHEVAESSFQDDLGRGRQITVLHKGLARRPELAAVFRLHSPDCFL